MHDQIVQKVSAIIDSCTNEQHIQVASQTVNMVCFEPGVGLSAAQVNTLIHLLNRKIDQLQQDLRAYTIQQEIKNSLTNEALPIEFNTHEGCGTQKHIDLTEDKTA